MSRSFICVRSTALVISMLTGCTARDGNHLATEREPVTAFTLHVAGGGNHPQVTAGETFTIEGTIDVSDPSILANFVTVKVIRPSADKNPVNMTGTNVKPSKSGTRYDYSAELKAPTQPGAYEVEARVSIDGSRYDIGRTAVQVDRQQ